jgi:large subunit ribosomal protein L7/L12
MAEHSTNPQEAGGSPSDDESSLRGNRPANNARQTGAEELTGAAWQGRTGATDFLGLDQEIHVGPLTETSFRAASSPLAAPANAGPAGASWLLELEGDPPGEETPVEEEAAPRSRAPSALDASWCEPSRPRRRLPGGMLQTIAAGLVLSALGTVGFKVWSERTSQSTPIDGPSASGARGDSLASNSDASGAPAESSPVEGAVASNELADATPSSTAESDASAAPSNEADAVSTALGQPAPTPADSSASDGSVNSGDLALATPPAGAPSEPSSANDPAAAPNTEGTGSLRALAQNPRPAPSDRIATIGGDDPSTTPAIGSPTPGVTSPPADSTAIAEATAPPSSPLDSTGQPTGQVGGTAGAEPAVPAASAAGADYSVVLVAGGDRKIQAIKEVRSITGLGLKEAKDLVDNAPRTVKSGLTKEQASTLQKQLEGAGATVSVSSATASSAPTAPTAPPAVPASDPASTLATPTLSANDALTPAPTVDAAADTNRPAPPVAASTEPAVAGATGAPSAVAPPAAPAGQDANAANLGNLPFAVGGLFRSGSPAPAPESVEDSIALSSALSGKAAAIRAAQENDKQSSAKQPNPREGELSDSAQRGGLRSASVEDLAGVWNQESIPFDAVGRKTKMLTPAVGRVRVLLKSKELFEGRLYAVGEGNVWIDTTYGRMGLDGTRIDKIERLATPANTPALGAKGSENLGGLDRVRIKTPGGIFFGKVISKDDKKTILITDDGAKVTLDTKDVEYLGQNPTVTIKKD